MQHPQVSLAENDIGSVSSDVGRRHHGDADIGRMERRRVVDTVPDEADHMTTPFQREDDPVLLGWRDPGENGHLLGVVSVGDMVKYRLSQLELETAVLRDYLAGQRASR